LKGIYPTLIDAISTQHKDTDCRAALRAEDHVAKFAVRRERVGTPLPTGCL